MVRSLSSHIHRIMPSQRHACFRYFQTALEAEEEEDGSVSVGSLCAAWDKVKADMNTVCVHPRPTLFAPILCFKPLICANIAVLPPRGLQLRLRGALLPSRMGFFQLLVQPRASSVRESGAAVGPKHYNRNSVFRFVQVELMRGEDMTPPEIVQLIAWSKE
jgi:hypothetical protein